MNTRKLPVKLMFLMIFIVFAYFSALFAEEANVKNYLKEKLAEAVKPKTSLLLWNLSKPGEASVEFRSKEPYKIASIIKLPILCVVLEKVKNGRSGRSHTDALSDKITVIKEDSGVFSGANYLKTGANFTILQLTTDMIVKSGNNSTNALIRWLGDGDYEKGEESVNDWLMQKGLRDTCLKRKMGEFPYDNTPLGRENYSNCADLAKLLKLIYEHKIIDYENSELILNLLKRSKKYGEIPAGIDDKGAVVANKTGEIPGYLHDAAIVFDKGNDYILVILTKSPDNKSSYMANLSKIIWDYYKKKSE